MDVKLVVINGKKIACDSRMVADCYKKKHAYVVRMIKKLISDFAGKRKRQRRDNSTPTILWIGISILI